MDVTEFIAHCDGFDWDRGNLEKNWVKHRVSQEECEQVFFNHPLAIFEDVSHSLEEKRWYVLGRTDLQRTLWMVFTLRKNRIRIVSARDMDKKERQDYEHHEKENPSL